MLIDFISTTTELIAQQLLGKLLIHQQKKHLFAGYIVETEAYLGIQDKACHSYQGKNTPKIQALYLAGGHIYIYSMHTHLMLNIVTQAQGIPQAVLIRAIEPAIDIFPQLNMPPTDGPGKLTKAMQINKGLNGSLINQANLSLSTQHSKTPLQITTSARIGIANKEPWTSAPLRFFVTGNPYVSQLKKSAKLAVKDCWL